MRSTVILPWTGLQKVLGLCGCGVFFVVVYVLNGLVQHSQVHTQLEQSVHAVEDRSPGWQFADLENARATIPDDENAALDVDRAANCLPEDYATSSMSLLIGSYTRTPYALTEDHCSALQKDRELYGKALAATRPLAEKSRGRFPFAASNQPWTTSAHHTNQVAAVVQFMMLEALYQADLGNREEAARACRAALQAARALGDEPVPGSQQLRRFLAVAATRGVQYLLNRGVCEPAMLADLQRLIEAEAEHPAFLIAMRGRRAITHAMLEAIESGQLPWNKLFFGARPGEYHWDLAVNRDEIRRQHMALLPYLEKTVKAAGQPSPLRATLLREMKNQIDEGDFPLLEPLVRDLPGLEQVFATHEGQLRCMVVALAVERYRYEHQDWPQSLAELTPAFLKQEQLDPADGLPLSYKTLNHGVLIFSQCVDDRGGRYQSDDITGRRGVAVRLWDVDLRGQSRPMQSRPMIEVPMRGPRGR